MNDTFLTVKSSFTYEKLCVSIFLCFFVLLTIAGNLMVIFSVIQERYLRTTTNYFIVSLATADLFMGAIVMPFSVILVITDDYWPFGQIWCYLWNALDVLSSTASILNLCMIALERYWAIQNPISHTTRITKCSCIMVIVCVWICSSAISFPAILWWQAVSQPEEFKCTFTDNTLYLISSSIFSFYAPLIVMTVVYYRIYRTASALIRNLNVGTKVIYKSGQQGEPIVLRIHRGGIQESSSLGNLSVTNSCNNLSSASNIRPKFCASMENLSVTCRPRSENNPNFSQCGNSLQLPQQLPMSSSIPKVSLSRASVGEEPEQHNSVRTDSANVSIATKLRNFEVKKRLSKFSREQKAAKTLGIVMGIFIVCWLPFFTCNIILAIDKTIVSVAVIKFVTWMGYINSSVNPIIYAHSMRDFRRAFIKLLCSKCLSQRFLLVINRPPPSTTSTNYRCAVTQPSDTY